MTQMIVVLCFIFITSIALSAQTGKEIKCQLDDDSKQIHVFDPVNNRLQMGVNTHRASRSILSRKIQQVPQVIVDSKRHYEFQVDDSTKAKITISKSGAGTGEFIQKNRGKITKYTSCELVE